MTYRHLYRSSWVPLPYYDEMLMGSIKCRFYMGNHSLVTSRRQHSLTLCPGLWLLDSFYSIFNNIPWVLEDVSLVLHLSMNIKQLLVLSSLGNCECLQLLPPASKSSLCDQSWSSWGSCFQNAKSIDLGQSLTAEPSL